MQHLGHLYLYSMLVQMEHNLLLTRFCLFANSVWYWDNRESNETSFTGGMELSLSWSSQSSSICPSSNGSSLVVVVVAIGMLSLHDPNKPKKLLPFVFIFVDCMEQACIHPKQTGVQPCALLETLLNVSRKVFLFKQSFSSLSKRTFDLPKRLFWLNFYQNKCSILQNILVNQFVFILCDFLYACALVNCSFRYMTEKW